LEELLTTRQLQDLLQVDRVTIYRMLADGRLRGFKVGGQWRLPRRQIEAWLQAQPSDAILDSPLLEKKRHPRGACSCRVQAIQAIAPTRWTWRS
jgi:excisionase family DNA binding protein